MAAAVWSTLADPWGEPLMRRALLEVAIVGLCGGALGCWVLFYELSYSAESLSHALFPGLVGAALLGLPLLLGAAGGIVAAALAVGLAGRIPGIGRDTAVAIVVTGMFGLGALLALSPDTPAGLQELLFGDVLGVSDGDLALAAGLSLLVVAGLAIAHGRLLAVGFDRGAARGLGVSPGVADAVVLVLLAVTILVAVQGLGNLLVVAVLVGPAATAQVLTRRMGPMMATSIAVAWLCGAGGLYLSYYAGTAAGASIAGLLVAVYLLSRVGWRAA